MKKTILLIMIALLAISAGKTFGQSNKKSVEVLYFKANLACCKAKACNALQNDVDSVIVKYFQDENIQFNVIKLADEANKELVSRFNAKSQTVVIICKKKKKENVVDASAIVASYFKTKDKAKFEAEMKDKINESLEF